MTDYLKNQKIKWSRETVRKTKKNPKGKGRIDGLLIYNKDEKTKDSPLGLCGSIEITTGGFLQVWTNKKFRFIPKETAIVLLDKLLDFYNLGLGEIDKRITKLEKKVKKDER